MMKSCFLYKKMLLVVVTCLPLCFLQCKKNAAEEFKSKGGLRVHLIIDEPHLLTLLSGNNPDAVFRKAIDIAASRKKTEHRNFVELFVEEYRKLDGDKRLSVLFGTYDLKDKISPQSTDKDVVLVLKNELREVRAYTMDALFNRMEKYGVIPVVKWLDSEDCIQLDIPGVEEPEQILSMLESHAVLEFWETYDSNEINAYLTQIDTMLLSLLPSDRQATDWMTGIRGEEIVEDDLKMKDAVKEELDALAESSAAGTNPVFSSDEFALQHPLFSKLIPNGNNGVYASGPVVGLASGENMDIVIKYLEIPEIKQLLPSPVVFEWSAKPLDDSGKYYALYALKKTSYGGASLNGEVVDKVSVSSEQMGYYSIDLQMNSEGARAWRRITAENIGRSIAIVIDHAVYSAPLVNMEISGGRSMITGNFSKKEALDLVNLLSAGKMAPVMIIHSEMVAPGE